MYIIYYILNHIHVGFAQTAAVRRICRDVFMLAVLSLRGFPISPPTAKHMHSNSCALGLTAKTPLTLLSTRSRSALCTSLCIYYAFT